MSVKRGKGGDNGRQRPASSPQIHEPGGAWGKTPGSGAPRSPHASPHHAGQNGFPAAPSGRTPSRAVTAHVAALAARNLGGFVPNKIFVGGVPIACTEEQFKGYFEPFGAISKVELYALRGFGYITYESVESVDACLERYDDHYLCKKWVEVKRSIPRDMIDGYEREQKRLLAEIEREGSGASSLPAPAGGGQGTPKADVHVHSPDRTGGHSALDARSAHPSAGVRPHHEEKKDVGARWGGVASPVVAPIASPGLKPQAPSATAIVSKVAQLKEMGFSEEVARRVLSECVWDVNEAIDRLLAAGTLPDAIAEPAGADSGPPDDVSQVPVAAGGNSSSSSAPAARSQPAVRGTAPDAAQEREPPRASPPSPAAGRAGRSPSDAATSRAEPEPLPARPEPEQGPSVEEATAVPSPAPAASQEFSGAAAPPADAADTTPTEVAPRKRIEQVGRTWSAEDPSQLGVTDGEFVDIWTDTRTEHGWIHAERFGSDAEPRAGWLPAFVLRELPESQRWMRAKTPWKALDSSQCDVAEGAAVLVWTDTRTKEGWTYADAKGNEATGDQAAAGGWLPVFCLDWPAD